MQTINLLFSRWTQTAALLLLTGALAWTVKLGVIVASEGRIIDTGAAAVLMKVGLISFFIGSTGIGVRLSARCAPLLRALAILLSPVLMFGSFLLFAAVLTPVVPYLSIPYMRQEGAIGLAVIVYAAVGTWLYRYARKARA